jgi:solute carrier family 50 protein (sugar transporter)
MISINRQSGYHQSHHHQSHRRHVILRVVVTCLSSTTIIVLLLLSLLQQVNGFSSTANNVLGRVVKLRSSTITTTTTNVAHQSPLLLSFKKNHHLRPIITTTATRLTTRPTTTRPTTMTMMSMLVVPNEHLLRIAESYAPKFGVVSSIVLYLAPAKAVWDIISKSKSKSNKNQKNKLDGLNPIPIAIMPCVAISWFIYGLVSSDTYIIIGNGIGSVLSIAYLIGILPLMNNPNHDNNNTINNNNKQLFWTQITVLISSITTLGLWSILGFFTSDSSSKSVVNGAVLGEALGIYASIIFIILCSSPLSTISNVIKTKNSSSILGRLTISQCINTTLWSIYGLAVNDRFVYGPNIIVSSSQVLIQLLTRTRTQCTDII